MASVNIKSVTIDICSKCGGVWIDGGEIETLLDPKLSKKLFSEQSSGSAWSEADILSPLIDAAFNAL